jgi:hypothetical protein
MPATKAPSKPMTFVQSTNESVPAESNTLGTTQEEYNYITKGYRIQIESGLDMKKGYTMKDIQTERHNDYYLEMKALYRDGSTAPCAIMVITQYQSDINGWGVHTYYYCIPHWASSQKIWDDYDYSMNTLAEARDVLAVTRAICWASARAAAYFAQNN